jgi:hypothetical protein
VAQWKSNFEAGVFYFFVAFIWLALGLLLFLAPDLMPSAARNIPGTEISLGWICVALFLWRLYGWWEWRAREQRRMLRELQASRRPPVSNEYHPEFDFHGDKHDTPPGK